MKRMLMTLAAAAGLTVTAGAARADWGGYTTAGPAAPAAAPVPGQVAGPNTLFGAGAPGPQGPTQYGLNPHLRKMFRLNGGCNTCDGYGKHGGYGGPGGFGGGYGAGGFGGGGAGGPGYAPPYTPVMQGTLAFPHHPFVRSPRDFFMYEPNR